MTDLVAVKPAQKQISNYIAVAAVALGNALPLITPQLLTAVGVSPAVATASLTIAGVLLAAYQQRQSATIVPTPESPK